MNCKRSFLICVLLFFYVFLHAQTAFSYQDEFIGMALKTTTPKIYNKVEYEISYLALEVDFAAMEKYRKDHGYNNYNGYNRDNDTRIDEYLLENFWEKYVIDNSVDEKGTATYTGSGVVISENGYIATNCHVIEIPKEELKESFKKSDSYKSSTNLSSDFEKFFSRSIEKCSKLYDIDKEKLKELEEEWAEALADTLLAVAKEYLEEDIFEDEIEYINEEGETETFNWDWKDFLKTFYKKILANEYSENLSLIKIYEKYWENLLHIFDDGFMKFVPGLQTVTVVFPTADGKTDYKNAQKYQAKIIQKGKVTESPKTDSDEEESDEVEPTPEDYAILKIDAANLISLPLSNRYPKEASTILAAGFPGVSSHIFEIKDMSLETLAVTITDGKITRQVPLQNSDYKLLQTNAIIEHGNSGGPSVNSNLQVVGLNTYGLSETTGYYWMIPSKIIIDITKQNSINIFSSDISNLFLEALQAWQNQDYIEAESKLKKVSEINPKTPFIGEFLEEISELAGSQRLLESKKADIESPISDDQTDIENSISKKGLSGKQITEIIIIIISIALLSFVIVKTMFEKNKDKEKII